MDPFDHLLVVVDPTSAHGEGSLPVARRALDTGGSVTLLVFLSGEEAAALRAFAESEEVSLVRAAEIYLRQVSDRIGPEGVGTTSVPGDDLADDLLTAIDDTAATALVIPASVAGRRPRLVHRLTAEAKVPVVIAPWRHAAAG